MPVNRYYLDIPLDVGTVRLPESEAHHLYVLRTQPQEQFEITNGRGLLARAQLLHLTKKEATAQIIEIEHHTRHPYPLQLYQAYTKGNKLSYIIEKAVELGASQILFYPSDRGEPLPKDREGVLERLKSVAVAAIKQCGSLYLPEIAFIPPISHWTPSATQNLFYGDPIARDSFSTALTSEIESTSTLVIGPESGFSPAEIAHLQQLKARGILLHHHVLRTETAGLVGLSIYYQIRMDQHHRI
jgi:16S rRNA (uracil1498-N3)-methyltransferase